MRRLKIRNIGPIQEIDIELDKLNVFIGQQSSGKSTITKIACYCSWVEKKIALLDSNQELFVTEGYFAKELIRFHKLEGYLQEDSYIYYESGILTIEYTHSTRKPSFEWKARIDYKRGKISYIPSERNMVAAVPNWMDIKFVDNYFRNTISDWVEAREAHKKNSPLSILNIGAKYFYENGNDNVVVNKMGKTLELTYTSSGLQSLIPLFVLVDYFYDWIYHNESPKSVKDNIKEMGEIKKIIDSFLDRQEVANNKESILPFLNQLDDFVERKIHYTNVYLEEPEQNLFPEAQRDLVGELVRLNNLNEDHSLTVTTHSPYILSSINNLIYAQQVGEKNEANVASIIPKHSWVDFDNVRAYFVSNGTAYSILDDEIGQIKAEAIDGVSNILNKEYEDLLEIDN